MDITATSLSFWDDACGTLRLLDGLGDAGAGSLAGDAGGLFVYVGADDDGGKAEWKQLSAWGAGLGWDPLSATRSPSAQPTPEPTAREAGEDLVDDFSAGFDPSLWLTPCAGCVVAGGQLLVTGDSMLQRTVGKLTGLAHLRGHLTKDASCNDHFLGVSTDPALGWSWGTTAGAARFLW